MLKTDEHIIRLQFIDIAVTQSERELKNDICSILFLSEGFVKFKWPQNPEIDFVIESRRLYVQFLLF